MGDAESGATESLWGRAWLPAGRVLTLALLLALGLSMCSRAAAASLEKVNTWASSGEAVQLGGIAGMAVNVTGAGGVQAGTIYAVTQGPSGQSVEVARFNPDETFSEGWEVKALEVPYERCGPDGEVAHPHCLTRPEGEVRAIDVDVDQVTGNVYVYNGTSVPGRLGIVEYNPDGSEVIARFGEIAPGGEKTSASPGKIHNSPYPAGIAVNATGDVYVFDTNGSDNLYHRLMVFRPKTPGNYSEYQYSGEIAGGFLNENEYPTKPVVDEAGNVYVAGESYIEQYAPEAPGAYPHHSAAICSFEYKPGGITAMTVNPETGEPVFFTYKKVTGIKFKLLHKLSACEGGKFKETGTIEVSPERDDLWALAFDPKRKYSENREPGVLYGGAPGPIPSSAVGQGEPGTTSLGYSFAPSVESPPTVESQSASRVIATSARLQAEISPHNFETRYAFQYIPEAAYEANEPAERQSVTVAATGGIFRLGFEGQTTGGAALANLTAGSAGVTSLVTAKGTANTTAGKEVLSGVTTSFGAFQVGQPITGTGIPASAHVTAVEPGQITLSTPATATGAGVAISSAGPMPLAVGEQVEGPGIVPGTTIVDAKAGQLTLSTPASASGAGVTLQTGLPAAVSAGEMQRALQNLVSVGAGNATVSGGPGNEAGSSPYEIVFAAGLGDANLPQLTADATRLTGGPASATVSTEHDGGNGFASGTIEVPPGGAVLGAGEGTIAAAALIKGLTPGTVYHYRVIATSHCSPSEVGKVCQAFGPDQYLRTYPLQGAALPDGRAYELVSPPQKNGGQVLPAEPVTSSCQPVECKPGAAYQHFPMQSSPDGNAIVYEGSPFFPGKGAVIENEYLSRRGDSGWSTANLTPGPLTSKGGQGYKAFDPSLNLGVLEQTAPALTLDAPAEYDNLYGQLTASPGSVTPLLRDLPSPPNPNHLPFNRPQGEGLDGFKLRYAGASADLSRLFFAANDALTAASAVAPEAIDGGVGKANLYEWEHGELSLVNVLPGNTTTAPGASFGPTTSSTPYAISTDGSHVFWSAESGQVYVRIGGTQTIEVKDSGKFLSASADGSKALLNDGCLYDLAKELCEDLTDGKGGFLGIAGQSVDLSHVYFLDQRALTGENPAGKVPNEHGEGEDNLYEWNEGSLSFIATLLAGDSADWEATPARRMAEASPGGRWFTFLSKAPLTGFDNVGPCGFNAQKQEYFDAPCNEVFLFDAVSGNLRCASCSPANARPVGPSILRLNKDAPLSLPQPHYLTDAGRLYFDSQDSLAATDTNGRVEDVYELEPAGLGACVQPGGCVSLISAGRESIDSNFLTIDELGENVFFTSRDRLVTADTDELIDLYDARVGGVPSESVSPKGCGESCQPSSTGAQAEPPASSTLADPGNVPQKGCKKGQVKKKGKCVKKPKHKKQQNRKANQARGGAK